MDYEIGQEVISSAYAEAIRMRWLEIMDLSVQFRVGLMIYDEDGKVQGCDPEVAREYIARLSRMWLELSPKVEGNIAFDTSWRDKTDEEEVGKYANLKKDFLKFRKHSANPALFYPNKNGTSIDENELFLMEEILRKVIEKLGITGF